MKKLFSVADRYIAGCTWKDIAVLKFCLLALGMLAGLCVPKKHKTMAAAAATAVFVATYVPQMIRFVPMFVDGLRGDK